MHPRHMLETRGFGCSGSQPDIAIGIWWEGQAHPRNETPPNLPRQSRFGILVCGRLVAGRQCRWLCDCRVWGIIACCERWLKLVAFHCVRTWGCASREDRSEKKWMDNNGGGGALLVAHSVAVSSSDYMCAEWEGSGRLSFLDFIMRAERSNWRAPTFIK